ncbi:glycosyltransferase [uncultured Aliiroseovarius sp.]|uniref:glycosyltransferase n=1 Tax=uncultured Aliiroseovarius sp. TaxID=1658783 RepID=UPI00262CF187|nr:glycosyltransferase [uncultured Aliiroseovarius sp.]
MTYTRSIFVTNNGLTDHIGVAQVLPYLEALSSRGHKIAVLSVERPDQQDLYRTEIAPRLARAGIVHSPILRHRSSLAGKLERFAMPSLLLSRLDGLVTAFRPDVLHCRSYMPLGAVLQVSQRRAVPFVFDMRGFWVDERCESGIWRGPVGRSYALHFRRLETQALAKASAVITLTEDARELVAARASYNNCPIEVIPCSVDQTRFAPDRALRQSWRKQLGFGIHDVVLAHLGSAGPLYRIDATYRLTAALRAQGVRSKLLLIGDHRAKDHIDAANGHGITLGDNEILCRQVPHQDVPSLLNAADLGLSFRVTKPSSLGASATKVGEYLSCGLPVISNAGIGDIHRVVPDPAIGLVLDGLSDADLQAAATKIATARFASRSTIRDRVAGRFDLDAACDRYDGVYQSFAQRKQAA